MPTVPHDLFKRMRERTDDSGGPDACWLWTGYTDRDGYGMLWVKVGNDPARNHRANRLSYLIHTGDIPKGMFVCHRCDNPQCVNPSHLFLGSPQDNMIDKFAKGRGNLLGAPKPNARKLSDDQAREVRILRGQGVSSAQLARQYGVNVKTITNIVTGRHWEHLDA